jgi:L-histidine N-alpha-methyltransferase
VRVRQAGLDLRLSEGEEIRTEISCKYTRASVEALVAGSSLGLAWWETDPGSLFALALLQPVTA